MEACGKRLLSGTRDPSEGFRVIQIEYTAFFVRGELADLRAMCPHYGARSHVEWRGLQFWKKFYGENHRVPPAPFEHRQSNRRLRRVKRSDQVANETGAD